VIDPAAVTAIAQVAGSLTITGLLLIIVWAYASGKIPTQGEIKRIEDSEKRAWEQAAEAKDALKANNQVMERMADTVAHLRETIDAVVRGRANA
jgi:hypothetical protein